jgi:hypothetical protein
MATTGVGEITCECREKKDVVSAHEWAFVAPVATLCAADRRVVGKGKRQHVAYEADCVFYGG